MNENNSERSGSGAYKNPEYSGSMQTLIEVPCKNRLKSSAIAAVVVAAAVSVLFLFGCSNYMAVAAASPSLTVAEEPSQPTLVSAAASSSDTAPQITPQPTPQPTSQTTPSAAIDPNNWRLKFADKFSSDGKVYKNKHSYKSANININITKNKVHGVVYFVADIYIADLKYFKTAFGRKSNVLGGTEYVYKALKKNKGVIGINGDYCTRNPGLIIRNGKEYKKWKRSWNDELVMYSDGSMKSFKAGYNWNEIRAQRPYQAWGFGPALLDDNGKPVKIDYDKRYNPRTVIGYYEPGHYCFVVVDGRQKGYSYPGATLTHMSQFMYDLGCKVAFNLDGGGSSQLAFMGKEINKPCKTYRKDSDIIFITDED